MNAVQEASSLRRQGLREQLLLAAEQAISANGLADLRARALAETVGCSVGAIYNAYQDMDALILAVNSRTLAAIDAVMAAASGPPAEQLAGMAARYLGYAAANRHRWAALFSHQMASGRSVPEDYVRQQDRAFSHIEAPLAGLRPDLAPDACRDLARTLFAAVHGVVALGLDEKVAAMPLPALEAQLRALIGAVTAGLALERG